MTREQVPIVMGVLYHRDKDALQSRLQFRGAPQPAYLRRTRWRHFATAAQVRDTLQRIEQQFTTLVAGIGGETILKAKFPVNASDQAVLERLLASGIPALIL